MWTISPSNMGNFVGGPTGESVIIDWDLPGSAQLCAIPTNPCYDPIPVCLDITVSPLPIMDDPPNITVCLGEQVNVYFSGQGNYIYQWSNNNPAIGLPSSGTGNLDFISENPYNIPITAVMSVQCYENGCQGNGEVFGITVLPAPEITTAPSDVTACAGTQVVVNFSGSPANGFSWENSNPAIGLAASGMGNLNFTAASVTQQEVATVTVTPLYSSGGVTCAGEPVEFDITINPGPTMDDPPDISVCAGAPVSITFTGDGSGFSWTNSNTAIGLGASGTGNLNFTAANVAVVQTGTVTVAPTGGAGGCPGVPQTFTISVQPLPTLTQPANVTACGGANISVSFSGTAGSSFSWTNSNPNIGLPANGTDNLNFTAALVTQTEVATLTVTPILNGCAGAPKTFQITIKPQPVMDAPPDLTVCAETEVTVDFTAQPPGATFAWTNSNPAIGLAASGSGNIAFTASNWPVAQSGGVTVVPTLNGCAGPSYTFSINVLPAPVMDDPPDVTVCGGAPVSVVFNGTGGSSYSWQNSNPSIGLPASGSGPFINFSAANVQSDQTATVTVTPVKGICTGQPVTFQITVERCCATSAGDLDTSAIAVCGPKTVQVIHLGNENLEPNDTIRFILYSNPDNPMGSIVQYSDTLQFPFLQGVMHFDSVYYAAAIAGPQMANDSIDASAACFSLMKGPELLWRSIPTITVGSPPDSVCRDGCADVLFTFTGTPPFEFTWLIDQGGQVLIERTETATGYSLTLTVCPSDFDVPATGGYTDFRVSFLMDMFCGCGD